MFNLHGEKIMRTSVLEDTDIGVKIGGTVINNLRYIDDTTIIVEDPNDLELLVDKVKHGGAEVDLELILVNQK
jgi:hypothetical protein